MSHDLPWFPLYVDDFLQDEAVKLMDNRARGAYLMLLCHQWQHGSIPDNPKLQSRICHEYEHEDSWPDVWKQIAEKFCRAGDGRLVNRRLQREYRAAKQTAKRRANPEKHAVGRFVYAAMRGDGLIKIGFTRNPHRRMAMLTLETNLSHTLLAVAPGTTALERSALRSLAAHSAGGETFQDVAAVRVWIQEHLGATAGEPHGETPANHHKPTIQSQSEVQPQAETENRKSTALVHVGGVEASTQRRQTVEAALHLAAETVFAYWQAKLGHPGAILDRKRAARLEARLRENGGDVSELLYAVDGALRDDWLMGRDPKAPRRYDGIETVFRDRAQVERLVATVPGRNGQHPFLSAPT